MDLSKLEELSQVIEDEKVEGETTSFSTLPDIVEPLAADVAAREVVGVVVLDASKLDGWERRYGAEAFEQFMQKLMAGADKLRGDKLREQDVVCRHAPGGDAVLVFLKSPREEQTSAASEGLDGAALRLKEILERRLSGRSARVDRALAEIMAGSALLVHNGAVDARREIYRAVRQARKNAKVTFAELQRRRRRIVGHMIAHQNIETCYQPIVDMGTGGVLGYEALSRAGHDEAEYFGEHLFSVASKAELDGELDQTCRDLSIARRPELIGDRKLFVNCLPSTFYEPTEDLDLVLGSWESDGLAPEQLVFEITENITQRQASQILPAVRRLRKRGYQFALDDMGTGTTNLQLLAELEPDYIKMDISLTRGLGSSVRKQALASYLLDLGEKSDAELIAEGIESKKDRDTLVELGFHYGQGFLLGRPKES